MGSQIFSRLYFCGLKRLNKKFLTVQLLIDETDGNPDSDFVPHFPSSDVRNGEAGLERCVMMSALPAICTALVPQVQKPLVYISLQRIGDPVTRKERIRRLQALDRSESFLDADYNVIEVSSAKMITAVERAAKGALAVSTGVAEKSSLSNVRFVGDMNRKFDGKYSGEGTLSRAFAEIGDESAFKDAGAHCVPVE